MKYGLINIRTNPRLTEEKAQRKLAELVVNNIISTNHAIHQIEQLSHQERIWIGELKKAGKLFLSKLMKTEEHFDDLADNENTIDLMDAQFDFMKEINTIHLSEMKRMTNIIRAYNIDQERMIEAAKEIMEDELEKNR